MRTLRNVFRRKLRAFLTIFGITIGVFALVVMGAMAEKLNLLVDGGTRWYSDKVIVTEGNALGGFSANLMSVDRIAEIEAVEGVAKASARVTMTLSEKVNAVSMGPPALIIGTDLRGREFDSFKTTLVEGRDLKPGDRGKVVVGSDLVKKLNAKVGTKVIIRGKRFEVIGILEKTLTGPDTSVMMPLYDAQLLFHKSLPKVVRTQIEPDKLATAFTTYVKEGYNPDKVAKAIEKKVENVRATGPTSFQKQVTNSVKIFTSIIFGIALISLLVGGLSVINTMMMSISERTREIGIRKAIGASDGAIVRQFLAESALIGLIGGVVGLMMGWIFTLAANGAGTEAGTTLFLVTNRLAVGSLVFALCLGLLSGLYPSWRAARLNPVIALRYE
jgi:putative ABC transport system permease protein